MSPYCPPPPPPVIFEERVALENERTRATSSGSLAFSRGVTYTIVVDVTPKASQRMQIADGTITPPLSGNVIPMRAVNPSLKKKMRTERMSRLERDYRW